MGWFIKIVRYLSIGLVTLAVIVVVTILVAVPLRRAGYGLAIFSEQIDPNTTNLVSNYIDGVAGSIIALISAILLYVTLHEQRKQNKRDRTAQVFYEMLHIHCDNVDSMILKQDGEGDLNGRAVFSRLLAVYNKIYEAIDGYVTNISINSNDNEVTAYLKDKDLRNRLVMRFASGYFYYGSQNYTLKTSVPVEKSIQKNIKGMMDIAGFFSEPLNVMLGHYYRHMYQTIMWITRADCLVEDEKYDYAKQLRAQLDDEEQLLLYYNAMSDVGTDWLDYKAYETKKRKKKHQKERISYSSPEDMCPLARFRLIKNIPSYLAVKGIHPRDQFEKEIQYYNRNGLPFFESIDCSDVEPNPSKQ